MTKNEDYHNEPPSRPGLDYHSFPQLEGESGEAWWNRYLDAIADYDKRERDFIANQTIDLMAALRKR